MFFTVTLRKVCPSGVFFIYLFSAVAKSYRKKKPGSTQSWSEEIPAIFYVLKKSLGLRHTE